MTEQVFRSRIAAEVHENAEGLANAGLIDKRTMREIGRASCRERVLMPV